MSSRDAYPQTYTRKFRLPRESNYVSAVAQPCDAVRHYLVPGAESNCPFIYLIGLLNLDTHSYATPRDTPNVMRDNELPCVHLWCGARAPISLSVIPLFILMGQVASRTGLSADLFVAASAMLARVRAADIAAAHDAYMQARGLPPELRLYAHSQGYDMVERPLIRSDETMTVEEGMCLAVHPGYETPSIFAVICDNYLVGCNGPGACLHQTSKEIFELG